jgi:O-antigen ligase
MNILNQFESRSRAKLFVQINNWVIVNQRRLIKVLIVSAVLVLSAGITIILPSKNFILIMVMVAALGAAIIYLKYPPLGLIVLITGAFLLSYELGTGTQTGLNIAILLLPLMIGVWFIDKLVRQRTLQIFWSRTFFPLVGFVLICLLAFGLGQLQWFVFADQAPLRSQFGGLAIFLLSAGAYVLTANIIPDIKWLKRLTLTFMLMVSAYILIRFFLQMDRSLNGWMPGGSTGSLLWIWIAAIGLSQFLINRDLKLIWRVGLLALVGMSLYVSVVGEFGWKSGWIPPLATIGVIIWIRFPRLRIILALGGVYAIYSMSGELIQSDQYSYITRVEAWKIMLNEIVRVNPLLGFGPANYRFYTPLFPIMGYYVEFNSHNNYIDLLAQVGILGLLSYLWFALEIFRAGWGLLKKKLDYFSQAYVTGALGGLVGMLIAGMLGDWVLPFVYNVGMQGFRTSVLGWIFLGGVVVIEQLVANGKLGTSKDRNIHK